MSKKIKKRKSNTKIITLIFIGIILLLGLGCSFYIYNNKRNRAKVILVDKLDVQINEEVMINSFVKEIKNGKLINGNDKVNASKVGKLKLELLIENKNNEQEKFNFNISVIDTISPVIEANKEVNVYVGSNIDLLKDVKVSDNSLEDIKASIVGNYDINTIGEYSLKYVAVDSSNNKCEYDFILNVTNDPNNRVFTTSNGFTGKVVDGVTYIDGVLIANKTYSLPSNYGNGLTSDTQNAFNLMQADARTLGLNLWLSSGYRSYYDQQYIYNNYVARDGVDLADTYSARAGHSEHQTGLAFDLNTIEESFSYTDEGIWVHNNCYKYGFILRYPKGKDSITGYMYESWHLRYVGVDLATKLYNDGDWITLEEYFGIDSKYN